MASAVTRILAIDPGSEQSAWVLWDGTIQGFGLWLNGELLDTLRSRTFEWAKADVVAIEQMRGFLRTAGLEVFETCRWAGRFEEAVQPTPVALLGRKEVVIHLTGSGRGNDSDVRAALIDRFGGAGGKAAAVGLKASPGPLYGIARDVWSALAIALTYADTAT